MRRKNLLKELGIQKQADTSCNALDIDTENIRQRVYAKLDFADTERKQTTMRSKKKILPLLIAATLTIGVTAVAERFQCGQVHLHHVLIIHLFQRQNRLQRILGIDRY